MPKHHFTIKPFATSDEARAFTKRVRQNLNDGSEDFEAFIQPFGYPSPLFYIVVLVTDQFSTASVIFATLAADGRETSLRAGYTKR
jgi:hypothetical protein